jgi:hypothetical protein
MVDDHREPFDLVSPWLRNKAIRAAEKRVVAAAEAWREADRSWLATAEWKAACDELRKAVDALAALKAELVFCRVCGTSAPTGEAEGEV